MLTHNKASARVAEALGATFECEARNRLYFQGRPHDAFVYSLVPEDYVNESIFLNLALKVDINTIMMLSTSLMELRTDFLHRRID